MLNSSIIHGQFLADNNDLFSRILKIKSKIQCAVEIKIQFDFWQMDVVIALIFCLVIQYLYGTNLIHYYYYKCTKDF